LFIFLRVRIKRGRIFIESGKSALRGGKSADKLDTIGLFKSLQLKKPKNQLTPLPTLGYFELYTGCQVLQ